MPLTTRQKVRNTANRAKANHTYVRENPLDIPLNPHRECQFMGGMQIGPMCLEPSVTGFSYCALHMRICYL